MSLIRVLCRDYLCRCFLRRGTLEELLSKHQSVNIVISTTEENSSGKHKIEMADNNCMSIESDRISSSTSPEALSSTSYSAAGEITHNEINDKVYFKDSKYIRENEKNVLLMTKKNIVDMIESEINDNENYVKVSSKYDILLSMKKSGGVLSSAFPMIKMTYFINKADIHEKTTLKVIDQWMNNPSKRTKWDTSLKAYKKIEGDNEAYVIHTIMNKPAFFIAERDTIDKRIDFYYKDSFYCFSTSVKDDFIPLENGIIRVTNIFSGYKMYEDDNCYHFISITQGDMKMNVPQMVYNSTMPLKLKEWYDNLKKEINNYLTQIEKEKEAVNEKPLSVRSSPQEMMNNEDDKIALKNHEDIELK